MAPILLLVAALGLSAANQPPAETVTLPVSASATFAGGELRLTFDAVTRDNRCPKDVQCVVAGAAHARFIASRPDHDDVELLFEVPPDGSDRVGLDSWDITLDRLDPPARSTHRIEPDEYVASVRIARGNDTPPGNHRSTHSSLP